MPRLLVIEDQPYYIGLDLWDFIPESTEWTWDVVDHPSEIPDDVSVYDGILLDHRMPSMNGDEVVPILIERGSTYDKIVSISTFREGGYPPEVKWAGKMLSIRIVAALWKYFTGEGEWSAVEAARRNI
tara:strand:- start:2484 stop:2867 length:384 start_codon:yes stop_codon:yes gene_type:complete